MVRLLHHFRSQYTYSDKYCTSALNGEKGSYMSQTVTTYSDTPISGVTAPSLSLPVLNYDTDWRVISRSNNEVIISNNSLDIDEDETIRISVSPIKDIYNSLGLQTDAKAPLKNGYALLIQRKATVKVADTDSNGNVKYTYLPVSTHCVLKFPCNAVITDDYIKTALSRTLGALYENGVSKIVPMLKGAIDPKGL